VQIKRPKSAPAALALAVLTLVCGLRVVNPDFPERLERMTYDVRVRAAQQFPAPAATNLAFVSMEDSSIAAVRTNAFGYRFGLYWPRQVYGRVLEELGTYDPMIPETDARALLNGERINYWLSVGAQPSDKVSVLIKKYGVGGTHNEAQQQAIDDKKWVWHVGLDAQASEILNDLYNATEVDPARLVEYCIHLRFAH